MNGKQMLQLVSVLVNNANLEAVPSEVAQGIINDPKRSGAQFTAFLKNGGCVLVNGQPHILPIDRSKLFDPVAFPGLGKGFSVVEEDARSLALTEVDFSKVQLAHMLLKDEPHVKGETKLERLKADGRIRLDARIFQTLWENQHLIPESWKQKTNGYTTYVYFDGTVLRYPGGSRYVLGLCWRGGGWHWRCDWLDGGFDAGSPSALLAS